MGAEQQLRETPQNPIITQQPMFDVFVGKKSEIALEKVKYTPEAHQKAMQQLKNNGLDREATRLDSEYQQGKIKTMQDVKNFYEQNGIGRYFDALFQEIRQMELQKSKTPKVEIGQKEQMQSAANIKRSKDLAGFVGAAEEEGAKEGKKKLDKPKTEFFTS